MRRRLGGGRVEPVRRRHRPRRRRRATSRRRRAKNSERTAQHDDRRPRRARRDAARRGGAVAALNVITLEHAEAIASAAEPCGIPVIMQISENAVRFHGGRLRPIAAATAQSREDAAVAIALHLDHVTDDELLAQAPGAGFSSVMYDAGALPYDENVSAPGAPSMRARRRPLARGRARLRGRQAGRPASAHAEGVRTDPDEAASTSKHRRRRARSRGRQLARHDRRDRPPRRRLIARLRDGCPCRWCCTVRPASPTTSCARPSRPASRR